MIVALCGVSVIVAMILTLLSLKDAVVESTLQVPKSLTGDVIILSARTQTILRPAPFPKRFLDRLHAIDGVAAVPCSIEADPNFDGYARQSYLGHRGSHCSY